MTKEISRKSHPNFIEYQEFIVNHSNYKGLYFTRNEDNSIRWVVTGKSKDGQTRKNWWIEQCHSLNIKVEAGALSLAAVAIHPIKKHTCQICGESLSIEYVYPNKRLLGKLEKDLNLIIQPYTKTIFEILDEANRDDYFLKLFKLQKDSAFNLKELIYKFHVQSKSKSYLSPGVMSNAPDRFDGFHSDGNCCRSKSDKGRHKSNLQRYTQDRRVYENWADGDWKQADRLMAEFGKHGLSADHIGPISLGFCHRPKFQPMTASENAAKNNRMSLSDVQILIEDEKNGEQVVSWHSKWIWDKLKGKAQNDADALKLSKLMRENLHQVLTIFSIIDVAGFRPFLEGFLNEEYSYYDYKFKGFNPTDGTFTEVVKTEKRSKNQQNNVERYKRVAFESLEQYKNKDNRNTKFLITDLINDLIDFVLEFLEKDEKEFALDFLHEIFEVYATIFETKWEES
jgi:Alw26I/Eco31I/Esp3I family type II restriction endonuclease